MPITDRMRKRMSVMSWEDLELIVTRCRKGARSQNPGTKINSLHLLAIARKEQLERFPEKYQVMDDEECEF